MTATGIRNINGGGVQDLVRIDSATGQVAVIGPTGVTGNDCTDYAVPGVVRLTADHI